MIKSTNAAHRRRSRSGSPAVIHKVQPKYTKEARKNKIEGAVTLNVEVTFHLLDPQLLLNSK